MRDTPKLSLEIALEPLSPWSGPEILLYGQSYWSLLFPNNTPFAIDAQSFVLVCHLQVNLAVISLYESSFLIPDSSISLIVLHHTVRLLICDFGGHSEQIGTQCDKNEFWFLPMFK